MLWALALALPAHAEDPLFEKMQGEWEGVGRRVQLGSGHRSEIRVRTSASVAEHRLVSRNEITETPLNYPGAPKTYAREYWIRLRSPGVYDFGVGSGSAEKITSQGRLEGSILKVEQNLGGQPPFVIRSETELEDGTSVHLETAWYGETKLIETGIEYRRR